MLPVRGAARVPAIDTERRMSDSVLILLAILVAANIVLIAFALGRSVMRRRRVERERSVGLATTARPGSANGALTNGTAAATERASAPGAGDTPSLRTDPLTGLLVIAEWNRLLVDEAARIHRYGRPATVVFIELEGLERLTGVLGPGAADRILPALANVLARQARGSDHVARLGPGRFGVLLPETGEVAAVNYVERVRAACELWLESGAIAMRLAIGWAAPPPDGELADAFALAQDRMFAELRRGERRATDLAPEKAEPSNDFEGVPSPA
jgi:diguanylate cyclase (GGDEF)-like protein